MGSGFEKRRRKKRGARAHRKAQQGLVRGAKHGLQHGLRHGRGIGPAVVGLDAAACLPPHHVLDQLHVRLRRRQQQCRVPRRLHQAGPPHSGWPLRHCHVGMQCLQQHGKSGQVQRHRSSAQPAVNTLGQLGGSQSARNGRLRAQLQRAQGVGVDHVPHRAVTKKLRHNPPVGTRADFPRHHHGSGYIGTGRISSTSGGICYAWSRDVKRKSSVELGL